MATEEGYRLDEAAKEAAIGWMTTQKTMGIATWGNGRGARNLFERSKIKHATRLMEVTSSGRGMNLITGADVLAAATEMINSADDADLRIGFASILD